MDLHGDLALRMVDDAIVSEWLAGGKRNTTLPSLRAMFNDAASAKAGRLVDHNPFADLGISRGPGNRHKTPPPEAIVRALVKHARDLSGPYFAAWLQVAAFTGMRPGELDALRWSNVDFDAGLIRVAEQWSATSKTFTTPKNGQARHALLTPPARDALTGGRARTGARRREHAPLRAHAETSRQRDRAGVAIDVEVRGLQNVRHNGESRLNNTTIINDKMCFST